MESTIQNQEQAFFEEALAEALRITDRFVAEPVFALTGKGAYKGRGVEDLKADQALLTERAAAKQLRNG